MNLLVSNYEHQWRNNIPPETGIAAPREMILELPSAGEVLIIGPDAISPLAI